ncbi:MAG: glycosyltransferase [Vulcanimicrobiaceae bacterium]
MTPALDAGSFIGRTLASVRAQSYPNVEHVVVDGGSSDDTVALARAGGAVRILVEPGLGQAAAVNRGVAAGRGELVLVLNADDVLYPDGIALLVEALAADPAVAAAYGDAVHIDAADALIAPYPARAFDAAALLEECYICQPAAMVRRAAFEAIGGMDPRLDVALDYDFWIRLSREQTLRKVDGLIAGSRMHRGNKTLSRRGDVYREVLHILRAHYGYVPYSWAFAYASWLLQRADGFFERPRPTPAAVLGSLALGLWLNPAHPVRYLRDWYEHRSIAGRR